MSIRLTERPILMPFRRPALCPAAVPGRRLAAGAVGLRRPTERRAARDLKMLRGKHLGIVNVEQENRWPW